MLSVYIIQLTGVGCSAGDVLMEAVANKAGIDVFIKVGYFQAV